MNGDCTEGPKLDSEVAGVTGGGRGIGRAIARGLANAGASVALVARMKAQHEETTLLIKADGGRALAWSADVTDYPDIQQVVEEVEQSLVPITLPVNNAGRYHDGKGRLRLADFCSC